MCWIAFVCPSRWTLRLSSPTLCPGRLTCREHITGPLVSGCQLASATEAPAQDVSRAGVMRLHGSTKLSQSQHRLHLQARSHLPSGMLPSALGGNGFSGLVSPWKLRHCLSGPLKSADHPHPFRTSLHLFPAAAAKSLQSCPTLCDPMDSSPPGSPVHRIL